MRFSGPIASARQRVIEAALCSALLVAGPPAHAGLTEAITEAADASYPIIRAAGRAEAFAPFANRLTSLVLSASPASLAKTVDAGLDVFLSIPGAKVDATAEALASAVGGLQPATCELFPLPTELMERVARSDALAAADQAKLKAVNERSLAALRAVPKRDDAFCLPTRWLRRTHI